MVLYDFIACAGAKDQLDDAPADAAQIGGCHHLHRITTRVLTSGDSPDSNAFELQLVLQLRCEQRALQRCGGCSSKLLQASMVLCQAAALTAGVHLDGGELTQAFSSTASTI